MALTGQRLFYCQNMQRSVVMVKLTIKILEDALARVLLCAATVFDNDYGKLRNRKQDLKILSNLQKKYLEHIDNFTMEMQATNEKLQRETGLEIQ